MNFKSALVKATMQAIDLLSRLEQKPCRSVTSSRALLLCWGRKYHYQADLRAVL